MGLFVIFSLSDSQPPSVDGFCDHGLATTIINMDMPNRLFVPVGDPVQSFDRRPALRLCLQCQPQQALGGFKMIWEVHLCPPRHLGEDRIQ